MDSEQLAHDLSLCQDNLELLESQLSTERQLREKAEKNSEYFQNEYLKEKQRAEAAEARIKASQEQEPVMWYEAQESARGESAANVISSMAYSTRIHHEKPETSNPVWLLYAQPIIPPELEELQRENAELNRKLSELTNGK